jgi:hypothetical protein
MSADGIDIAIAEYQRWTKFDLPGRIQKPYHIFKDDPIPAGHPYWLKEIDPNQARALGLGTKIIKTRVLGFHPKIEKLAISSMSYRVEPAAKDVCGGADSASSAASVGPPAASVGPPAPPPPAD